MTEFDPFNKVRDGDEAFRRNHAKSQAIMRTRAVEEGAVKMLLKHFGVEKAVGEIKHLSPLVDGSKYPSFVGLRKTFPDFPYYVFPKRITYLDTIGLADLFDEKKLSKLQLYTSFVQAEEELETDQLPLVMVFGPVTGVKGKYFTLLRSKADSTVYDCYGSSIRLSLKDEQEGKKPPIVLFPYQAFLRRAEKRWMPTYNR